MNTMDILLLRVELFIFLLSFYIPEPSKLMEMPSKEISAAMSRITPNRCKWIANNHIVFTILTSRNWVVFIERMGLRSFQHIHLGFGLIPHITSNIVEITKFEHIDRARWEPKLKIFVPVLFALLIHALMIHWKIFVFGWQTNSFAQMFWFPVAECMGLQAVNFDWPIQRQRYDLIHRSQQVTFFFFDPKCGEGCWGFFQPLFPLIIPKI